MLWQTYREKHKPNNPTQEYLGYDSVYLYRNHGVLHHRIAAFTALEHQLEMTDVDIKAKHRVPYSFSASRTAWRTNQQTPRQDMLLEALDRDVQ